MISWDGIHLATGLVAAFRRLCAPALRAANAVALAEPGCGCLALLRKRAWCLRGWPVGVWRGLEGCIAYGLLTDPKSGPSKPQAGQGTPKKCFSTHCDSV